MFVIIITKKKEEGVVLQHIENDIWIKLQFMDAKLGDRRLNKRLELISSNMMTNPSFSIPKQNEGWKDTKGAYRFFSSDKISFADLIQPHVDLTKEIIKKRKLILAIQDTCHISFSHRNFVEGLSHIGGPNRTKDKGIILHTALAVDPTKKQPEVIGIFDQYIHRRTKLVDKNETCTQLQKRWRESKLWEEASQRMTLEDSNTGIVEIMDREGDVFNIMQNCLNLKHDFIIRAVHDRKLEGSDENNFLDLIKTLKSCGSIELDVRKKFGQQPRKALLNVSFSKIKIRAPKNKEGLIECNVVYVIEKDPPENQEPLEWILLTSINVTSFEDACQIINWYKCRWIIEEYHKCIKTGCSVEKIQLKEGERIENFLGVANIVAVRLLQLRDTARNAPNTSAKEIIDPLKVDLLIKRYDVQKEDVTIREYYLLLARLGGFLGRKSDGEPGWQILWKGNAHLEKLLEGAKLVL